MPAPKKKKKKSMSGQGAADRITKKNFSSKERSRGQATSKSLNRSQKELAIGVSPSSKFRGGLSPWEKGLKKTLKKGKKI